MKIGFLGLGIIGSAWAKNLIADGHDVRCWNRTRKDFPNFCDSIQDAVKEAEVVFIVVADPPAVQSVLDQILTLRETAQLNYLLCAPLSRESFTLLTDRVLRRLS